MEKLFDETPALRGWTEAEVVGDDGLQIVLGTGFGALPFGGKRSNSIHVGGGESGSGPVIRNRYLDDGAVAAGKHDETEVGVKEYSSQPM